MPEVARVDMQAGWTTVSLGDVVEVINDYWDRDTTTPERLVAGEHIDEGDMRIRRWGMTDDDLIPPTFNRRFQARDALLHSRNIDKVAQPDFGGITGEKIFILRSKNEELLIQNLIPYLVASDRFRQYAESRWAGSTNKFLNKTPLMQYEFALPPLEEQRRIAEALRASLQAHDSLLTAAITFGEVCEAKLQTLFAGASRGPLSAIAEKVTKGTTPTTQGHDYVQTEIPFLRAEDVLNREVNVRSCEKHIGIDAHQALVRSHILPKDVLVTIAGTIGRIGLVPDGIGEANCNQAVAIIRPTDPRDAQFLFTWLMSRDARNQMLGGKVTGTISNLSLTNIKNLQVPTLRPEERDQASREFEALVSNRKRIEGRVAELKGIQRNILNRSLHSEVG